MWHAIDVVDTPLRQPPLLFAEPGVPIEQQRRSAGVGNVRSSILNQPFFRADVPDGWPEARLASAVTVFGKQTLGAGGGFIVIYRDAPAGDAIPWRIALPGTLAGVVLCLAATIAFRVYVACPL